MTSATPTISVFLTVRNGADYLEESLRSIVGQTYQAHEILVHDCASTDATAEIARSFSGVTYFRDESPVSIAAARNRGVRMAAGELIAFTSHDDIWLPDKLRLQGRSFATDAELEFCLSHVRCFVEPGVDPASIGLPLDRIGSDIPGWVIEALVARKELFERVGYFDETFGQTDDTDWFSMAQDCGARMKMLDDTLVLKRLHGNNLTYSRERTERRVNEMVEIARRAIARKRK